MVRCNCRQRRKRRRCKNHVSRQFIKKEIMDINEVNVKDFASHRQYTMIMRAKGGVECFFKHNQNFRMHELAQEEHRERYIAGLLTMVFNNYKINKDVVYFALSAALARRDTDLATALLACRRLTTVREVLKALTTLDIRRRLQAVRSKAKRLELLNIRLKTSQLPKKVITQKYKQIAPKRRTLTGSVCRQVTKWVRSLSSTDLQAYIEEDKPAEKTSITKVWRLLADLCHFNPTTDFPALPSFLSYCFGEKEAYEKAVSAMEPPVGELQTLSIEVVHSDAALHALNGNQVVLRVSEADLSPCLTPDSKAKLVSFSDLNAIFEYRTLTELMCTPVDEILARRVAAEGPALAIKDGIGLISPILKYIHSVILARKANVCVQRVQFDHDSPDFHTAYHDPDRNVGLKTLNALMKLLDARIQKIKIRMMRPDLFLVVVDRVTYEEQVPEVDELDLVLDAGTLRLLTGSVLFGATGTEPTTQQFTMHFPNTAAEVIALAERPKFLHPTSRWTSVEVIERLHKKKQAVPIIAFFLRRTPGHSVYFIDSLLFAMESYSRNVHPSLFLILYYLDNQDEVALLNKIRNSDINSLIYTHSNSSGIIDQLVKLMTSPLTSLKTVEDQMSDIMVLLRREGVKTVFEKTVGQAPMEGPGPSGLTHMDQM